MIAATTKPADGVAAMEDLIASLEAAPGPDRSLDRQLMALAYRWEQKHIGAECWDDFESTCCAGAKHLDWVWVDPETEQWTTNAVDGFEFTASLDVAIALSARLLKPAALLDITGTWEPRFPDAHPAWSICWYPAGVHPDGIAWHAQVGSASTPALALCATILRAAQQEAQTAAAAEPAA
jgi:hypothetical protein